MKDADEAADENDDRADVLDNHRGVGNQGPEVVRLEAGVALQVIEEGFFVGVVVRIYTVRTR